MENNASANEPSHYAYATTVKGILSKFVVVPSGLSMVHLKQKLMVKPLTEVSDAVIENGFDPNTKSVDAGRRLAQFETLNSHVFKVQWVLSE